MAHVAMRSWLDWRGASPDLRFDADLVLEEILSNLIKYAWPQGGEHRIVLELDEHEDRLVLRFKDDGLPFDPRSVPAPEFTDKLEDRTTGKLGLHLVRRVADHFDYRREHGHNLLTVRLRIPLDDRQKA